MKILLLTDIPPCKRLTAGLVLDQLCRFLPEDSLVCFAIVNPANYSDAQLSTDLSWIPIRYRYKPREQYTYFKQLSFLNRFSLLKKLVSLIHEGYHDLFGINKLANEVVKFAKEAKVDRIWCVLQGQTMIRLALIMSEKLSLPLYSHVWDSQGWWLREHRVDTVTRHRIIKKFELVLRKSSSCYAASQAMAEKYNEDFGVRAISFFPSLDAKLALPPADKMHHRREFVIGIAGQIYATEEWARLVEALNSVKWVINGREIKIVIMGNRMFYSHIQFNEHVGFMQWGSQAETVKIMSDSDLLYCSYWFSPTFETEARLSFPSKLTTYLAAGRPVFFHGPEYASPARFLKENEAGILCHSLDKSKIINSISKIIHSPRLYAELANNGRKAFDKYLTLDTLKKSFADFLRVDENFLTGI